MSNWRLYVQGERLAANVQLEFSPEGGAGDKLQSGDTLAVEYPKNVRARGKVISVSMPTALIEVAGINWKIQHAEQGTWTVEAQETK